MPISDEPPSQAPDPVTEDSFAGPDGPAPSPAVAGPSCAWVRLQVRNTVLEFSDGAVVTLPIGVGDLARDVLRHDPPTSGELERGIDLVEDALAAARLPKADRGTLLSADTAVHALPGLEPSEALLDLAALEALFQRLASRALGTPVPDAELPKGRELAATLLVLRECMHHLGFSQIGVRASSSGAPTPR